MNSRCNGLENIRVRQCKLDYRTWEIHEVGQAVVQRKTNLDIILAFQKDRMLCLHPCNVDWDFHYYKRSGNQRKGKKIGNLVNNTTFDSMGFLDCVWDLFSWFISDSLGTWEKWTTNADDNPSLIVVYVMFQQPQQETWSETMKLHVVIIWLIMFLYIIYFRLKNDHRGRQWDHYINTTLFCHCLYQHNLIIRGKLCPGWKMLRIILLFLPVIILLP